MTEDLIKNTELENKNENQNCTCDEPTTSDVNDDSQELIKEINHLQEELGTLNERFLRLAAEYDNYRKRSEKDRISTFNDAKAKTVAEFLPLADSLERAIESSQDAEAEYLKGLEMLNELFISTLAKLGVESFGDVGDTFDPEMHNAISHVENEALGENSIAQVFQKGYKLGDKIVRHAMISVAN